MIRTMIAYLTESHRVTEQQVGHAMRRAITEGENMENILDKWERQWRQKGRQEGLQLGFADMTLLQLRQLLGSLDQTTEQRIRALPLEKLALLGESLLGFQAMDDLERWLQKHVPSPRPARKRTRK